MTNKKALIAMSGGVDSSVAAYLIKQQGHECMGVTMKLVADEYAPEPGTVCEKSCCSLGDIEDARSVAFSLDMPFHVFNFTGDFDKEVVSRFAKSYEKGETPNPCIDCNRYLKFERLYNRASDLGFYYVVTGHYARIEQSEDKSRFLLKKGLDASKDQSYALYTMTQEQLTHTLFPLGNLPKTEVRKIAESHSFINADKRDSQDICFVPDGDYAGFLHRYTGRPFAKGDIIDKHGKVLGRHDGIVNFTIGQRKGLGLSFPTPMYVSKISPKDNTVTLGPNEDLFSTTFTADRLNLISVDRFTSPTRLHASIRYRHTEQPATVTQLADDLLQIVFDEPQRAITPGQAVVLYDNDIVVGGGTICGAQA